MPTVGQFDANGQTVDDGRHSLDPPVNLGRADTYATAVERGIGGAYAIDADLLLERPGKPPLPGELF